MSDLTDREARNLYIQSEKLRATKFEAKWPNRQDKFRILKAVKRGDTEVTLTCGREFVIKYTDTYPDEVWIRIKKGAFVPCGWFNIPKLESELSEYNERTGSSA